MYIHNSRIALSILHDVYDALYKIVQPKDKA